MSDLSTFVRNQVIPALPANARHNNPAFWEARCRAIGLDFGDFKARLAEREGWHHSSKADPDAIPKMLNGIKKERRQLCDRILDEARNDAGRSTVAPGGPPPNVY